MTLHRLHRCQFSERNWKLTYFSNLIRTLFCSLLWFFVAIVVLEVICYLGHVKKCNVMYQSLYCRVRCTAVLMWLLKGQIECVTFTDVPCCSSTAIYAVSLKKVRQAMHHTAKNGCYERLPVEQEINLRPGLNSRPPSRKSRWCCLSRLWMATQRHCWPTLPRPPRSCVS